MIMRDVMVIPLQGGALVSMLALCAIAGLLTISAIVVLKRARKSPHERERKRRWVVNGKGRMGDAIITDVRDNLVIYEYSVRGVTYNASQDVSALSDLLPEDRLSLVGPASLKYHPQNPANSIVICERWSGLRVPTKQPLRQAARLAPSR